MPQRRPLGHATGHPRSIRHRTAHLPLTGRFLYRIEHYGSMAAVAIATVGAFVLLIVVGWAMGFPGGWLAAFEVSISIFTLIFVVAIQHTQAREQIATQRKLDELLRALPGAAESLIMLEEAPADVLHEVEEDQRERQHRAADAGGRARR